MNLTIREALLAFRRAPLLSALSVTTIAFSLFVLGLFGLVAVNLQRALHGVAERVEIVAYLLPGTPGETVTLALKDIEAFPEVQAAEYVSEDSALARAKRELVEFRDVLRELERNPLPASIEVKLKPAFRDAAHVNAVADRLRGFGFVDDVRFGRDWVEKLDRLRQLAAAVGVVVGGAFAAVAIIIIGTTAWRYCSAAARAPLCGSSAPPTASSGGRSCCKGRSRACLAGWWRWPSRSAPTTSSTGSCFRRRSSRRCRRSPSSGSARSSG